MQARQEEMRSHLEDVWNIDDVPKYNQHDPAEGMHGMLQAYKWAGVGKNNPQEIHTLLSLAEPQDDAVSMIFSK